MPSQPQINAFLASHQTAISQLAGAYCQQLVATPSAFSAFFGANAGALTSASGTSAGTFFGTAAPGNTANLALVVGPIVNNVVGPTAYPQASAAMTAELNTLILRVPNLNSSAKVSDAITAACSAALGSAATVVQ
jgi:hypothetical protein